MLVNSLEKSILTALYMFWEVFWPLVLGFGISAIVQAFVAHNKIGRLLGKNNLKQAGLASFLGMVSSSCSYAAVALARSLFTKGASFLNAMIFEIASTNLVIELGIILLVLMGWQFALAEIIGGLIMIAVVFIVFKIILPKNIEEKAREQAQKGLLGRMEGHAQMDMSVSGTGSFWSKFFSKRGFTVVSHYYVMDWVSVWQDIVLGFLIAGFLTVFVPQNFWRAFFFSDNPLLSGIVGPLVGPIVAIVSFVCSVGNIPLAAVLWNGGISFGGVISFIYADLIVLPILDIYRKYYGWKPTLYILIVFYATMVAAGYITEILFSVFGFVPKEHTVKAITEGIKFNSTSVVNIVFLMASLLLLNRFFRTRGMEMLKMMNKAPEKSHHH